MFVSQVGARAPNNLWPCVGNMASFLLPCVRSGCRRLTLSRFCLCQGCPGSTCFLRLVSHCVSCVRVRSEKQREREGRHISGRRINYARTHARTHTRRPTYARARARAHTHTHTRARARARTHTHVFSLSPSLSL